MTHYYDECCQLSPYISNTFSRESPKFQTDFHVSKRSPRHSKDLLGKLIDLEIQIFWVWSPPCAAGLVPTHTHRERDTQTHTHIHIRPHHQLGAVDTKGPWKWVLDWYTHTHASTHTHTYVYTYTHTLTHTHINMHAHTHTHTYTHAHS